MFEIAALLAGFGTLLIGIGVMIIATTWRLIAVPFHNYLPVGEHEATTELQESDAMDKIIALNDAFAQRAAALKS